MYSSTEENTSPLVHEIVQHIEIKKNLSFAEKETINN